MRRYDINALTAISWGSSAAGDATATRAKSARPAAPKDSPSDSWALWGSGLRGASIENADFCLIYIDSRLFRPFGFMMSSANTR
jgi:hypothetical protein